VADDDTEFDAATQTYKPKAPAVAGFPSVVALDANPLPDRTAPTKPRREQFPAGMAGMKAYQSALADHARAQTGGVDVGAEQRQALL
jgi:hypothetical protein